MLRLFTLCFLFLRFRFADGNTKQLLLSQSTFPSRKPSFNRTGRPTATRPAATKRPTITSSKHSTPVPTLNPTKQRVREVAGSLSLVIFLAGVLGVVLVIQVIYSLCKIWRSRISRENVGVSTHPGTELISPDDHSLELTANVGAGDSAPIDSDRTIV